MAAKRNDMLYAWLERVSAYEAWMTRIGNTGGSLSGYHINGQLVVVLRYANPEDGWELFIPASKKNHIADTLDAAAEFLGVDGCRGLVEKLNA